STAATAPTTSACSPPSASSRSKTGPASWPASRRASHPARRRADQMFLMRRATIGDVPTLHKLARMVHFINLPADKDIIADKALWSAECFAKAAGGRPAQPGQPASHNRGAGPVYAGGKSGGEDGLAAAVSRSDLFMFTLEDT